jgi:diphosphomevalonate decarboxylase
MKTTVIAHPNIALVKYWGKRDHTLNLPAAGSLSLTLGPIATRTSLRWTGEDGADQVRFNGVDASPKDAERLRRFLDRFRAMRSGLGAAVVETENDFPTAAGLASSSSGFAALALAASTAATLDLPSSELSVLARLGSGSAARSLHGGFVRMRRGQRADGTDAFAAPLDDVPAWPELRCVIAVTTEAQKDTPSTDGMNHTQATSPYYDAWIDTVEPAIERAIEAIGARDLAALGRVAEASALQMHASAIAADPGVLYFNGTTVDVIHAVRAARRDGLAAFFTIDAGPHVKVFTTEQGVADVVATVRQVPGVVRTILAEPGGDARVLTGVEAAR